MCIKLEGKWEPKSLLFGKRSTLYKEIYALKYKLFYCA